MAITVLAVMSFYSIALTVIVVVAFFTYAAVRVVIYRWQRVLKSIL